MTSSFSDSSLSSGGDYDIDEGDVDEGPITLAVKPSTVFEGSVSRSIPMGPKDDQFDSFEVDSGESGNPSGNEDVIKLSPGSENHSEHNSAESSVIVISEIPLQKSDTEPHFAPVSNRGTRKIPIVNKFTTNPNTYDMDFLLDPKIQKINQAGHRFAGSVKSPEPEKKKYSVNFLKKNKEDIAKIRAKREEPEMNFALSDLSPPRAIPVTEISQRFYSHIDKVKEKVNKIAEEIEQKNKEECTFQPQILTKRNSTRSVEDYVSNMYHYLEKKNAKLKKLAEEKEKSELNKSIEDLTFKPVICENSAKMIEAKRSGPIHERLYDISKQTEKSASTRNESLNISGLSLAVDSKPFVPTVNKVSHDIVRDKSIDILLYEDGLRRAKQQEMQQPQTHKKEKLISDRSEKVLIDKLVREFCDVCDEIEFGLEKVSYSKFTEVLYRMYFIRNEAENKNHDKERQLTLKLWKELSADSEFIGKDTLQSALLSIMNYVIPIPETVFTSQQKAEESEMSAYLTQPSPNPDKSAEEVRKFHNRYILLYENRVSKTHKSYLNRVYKQSHDLSFKPSISQYEFENISRNLSAENTKIEDYLIEQKKILDQKKEKIRKELETKEKTICTFKPAISKPPKFKSIKSPERIKETLSRDYLEMSKQNSDKPRTDRLYELSKLAKEKAVKKAQEEKMKRDYKIQEECSFQPTLVTNQHVDTKKPYARGIDKSIERMRRAREASEQVKAGKELKRDGGLRFDMDVRNQFKSSFDQISSREDPSRSVNDSRSIGNISRRTCNEDRKKEVATKIERQPSSYARHGQKMSKPEAARIQPNSSDSMANSLETPSFLTERTQDLHNLGSGVGMLQIDQSSIFPDSIDEHHTENVSDLSAPAPLNIESAKNKPRSSSSSSLSSIDSPDHLHKSNLRDDILNYNPSQDSVQASNTLDQQTIDSSSQPKAIKTESFVEGELKVLDNSLETDHTIVMTEAETDSHDEKRSLDTFSHNTSLEIPNAEESKENSPVNNPEEEFKSVEKTPNQPVVIKVKLGIGMEIKIEFKPTDNIESIIRLFIMKYNLKDKDATKFSHMVREALNKERGY